MLLLITGLPGSGKTTLAREYAAKYDTLQINSDLIRQELGLMGQYHPEDKKRVYDALLRRTREALLEGRREVVVDSTFYKESIREPFRRLAADCAAQLLWVEVQAQEHTIRERLQTPRPDSEADFAVYEKIKAEYEPLQEPHLVLTSDEIPLDDMTAAIHQYVVAHQNS